MLACKHALLPLENCPRQARPWDRRNAGQGGGVAGCYAVSAGIEIRKFNQTFTQCYIIYAMRGKVESQIICRENQKALAMNQNKIAESDHAKNQP